MHKKILLGVVCLFGMKINAAKEKDKKINNVRIVKKWHQRTDVKVAGTVIVTGIIATAIYFLRNNLKGKDQSSNDFAEMKREKHDKTDELKDINDGGFERKEVERSNADELIKTKEIEEEKNRNEESKAMILNIMETEKLDIMDDERIEYKTILIGPRIRVMNVLQDNTWYYNPNEDTIGSMVRTLVSYIQVFEDREESYRKRLNNNAENTLKKLFELNRIHLENLRSRRVQGVERDKSEISEYNKQVSDYNWESQRSTCCNKNIQDTRRCENCEAFVMYLLPIKNTDCNSALKHNDMLTETD